MEKVSGTRESRARLYIPMHCRWYKGGILGEWEERLPFLSIIFRSCCVCVCVFEERVHGGDEKKVNARRQ